MIERLKQLQANRKQFANPDELYSSLKSNTALRNDIEALSKAIYHKSVSGCSNCYFDAYIQLISLKIEIAMEKLKCSFLLLAGALLHDVVNYDNDLLCSNANITDELALYHLKTNPKCAKMFQKIPEDIDKLLAAYHLPGEVPPELSEEEKEALRVAELTQIAAEENLVSQIVTLLKNKTTKTAIKKAFSETKTVGTKNLTQRFLEELIKRADVIFETPVVVPPAKEEKPEIIVDAEKAENVLGPDSTEEKNIEAGSDEAKDLVIDHLKDLNQKLKDLETTNA